MRRVCLIIGILVCVLKGWTQTGTYIVSDFHEEELGEVLEMCQKAEVEKLLHVTPFASFGHYVWNPKFAPSGDASVADMVHKAECQGVRLGIFAQTDAISLNDRYFTPPYYKHLLRQGQVELFDAITEEEREFALRWTPFMEDPSTLNLLLVENEMISYGTLEPVRDVLLLHGCSRGVWGTQATPHRRAAEAYKIWDAPGRFVAPDAYLRDSVHTFLSCRVQAANLSYVIYSEELDTLDPYTKFRPWHRVSLAAKRQSCTTLEELEGVMAHAAGTDTEYGIFIDRHAMRNYGRLDELLKLMRNWDRLRKAEAFSPMQKQAFCDPYAEWHLEQTDDTTYLLYQQYSSRRYYCDFEHDTWEWNSPCDSRFGLRIAVQGEGGVSNLCLKTPNGMLFLPCTLQAGQFLLYGFDGQARITDLNYNTLELVDSMGVSYLSEGLSEVSFSCEVPPEKKTPSVQIRYIVREKPCVFTINGDAPFLE